MSDVIDPIAITSQLHETRATAMLMLGSNYPSLMAELDGALRKLQSRKNCNAIQAALTLIEGIAAEPVNALYIMAAAVEMIVPRRERFACAHGVILYGTRCLECDRNSGANT